MKLSSVALLAVSLIACKGCAAQSPGVIPGADGNTTAETPTEPPPPPDAPGPKIDANPATACPSGFVPKAGTNKGFSVAGQQRSFELRLPPASFTGPRPILFAFHGTSENGLKIITRAKLSEFVDRGFVVVAPDAVGNGSIWPVWDAMRTNESIPDKDVELFDAMLSCVAANHAIDKARVFATGHSAGGIMTNRLLRSRSNVLAGGIVASGVFDLTGPANAPPLEPMVAIVTWGGDNDTYSGTTPNGQSVPAFSFVEQASLASIHYASQPKVAHVRCRGANVGHAWLPLNAWFAETLLARPKGTTGPLAMTNAPSICSTAPYTLPPLAQIACPANATAGCQAACQLMADCGAENRTVGFTLKSELQAIGITATSCTTCVSGCAARASNASDAQALSCIAQKQAAATCGPGINGAWPLFEAIETCCANRTDSQVCVGVCTALNANPAVGAFIPTCAAIAN